MQEFLGSYREIAMKYILFHSIQRLWLWIALLGLGIFSMTLLSDKNRLFFKNISYPTTKEKKKNLFAILNLKILYLRKKKSLNSSFYLLHELKKTRISKESCFESKLWSSTQKEYHLKSICVRQNQNSPMTTELKLFIHPNCCQMLFS